jgi:hypothetical protein
LIKFINKKNSNYILIIFDFLGDCVDGCLSRDGEKEVKVIVGLSRDSSILLVVGLLFGLLALLFGLLLVLLFGLLLLNLISSESNILTVALLLPSLLVI